MFKVGFYLGSAFLKPCTTSLKLTRDSLFCGCITHKNQLGHLEAHSKSHGSLLFEITWQLFQRALTPPARPHLQRRLFGQTLPQQHSRQQPAKPAHQASEHCCLATAWGLGGELSLLPLQSWPGSGVRLLPGPANAPSRWEESAHFPLSMGDLEQNVPLLMG